jgi:tRNA-dihydrouridine synthase
MQQFPTHFRIGHLTIAPATVLAPMAGVTDTVFRRFIRNLGGCGLIMTEFTSSHGVRASMGARKPSQDDHQIPGVRAGRTSDFGTTLRVRSRRNGRCGARDARTLGFDILDLNFGCPVNKVVKCNGGSGCCAISRWWSACCVEVRAAISIPFTMKFRAGWNDQELVAVKMAQLAEDCGCRRSRCIRARASRIQRHGRLDPYRRSQSRGEDSVIGNGDILTPEDAVRMMPRDHCDGVMIGRAASSNPWIFRQIEEYLATGTYVEATQQDRYEMMRLYYSMLLERDDRDATGKMKQFATYFTHGVRHGAQLRHRSIRRTRCGNSRPGGPVFPGARAGAGGLTG